ncbi:hypothetical protein E3P92_02665 [Wallemia ichthyophaga]|uniref:Homologous-pairing protein 2 winged helix domain-containing protein n=1 Tax=Wallemia ichthyophaga TaxID=245174 RepID=A0A4T0L156_WALIC|nr:hypothetical protein E3P91_02938 [Wallemia ichthyophaga]TIA80030.1 hypothetical protein E3P98_02931 [Wallemia ichthyophaga]TIA88970.1 hypothetical protein E3P97_03282 [Wallemia ichthyophaga]TIA97819.1 hypothetical protein E3P94_03165 [Wallemia ichthyophaga]TIB02817.1 hypothetical protein E3P96_02064 [Wallemia ichthyophaga]
MRELFGCSTEPAIGDISTNLGQSVSKLATQKVLVACAERGVITSKAYGKQTVFVANQNDDTNAISPEDLAALVENNDHLRKEHQSLNEQIAHYNKGKCTWK